MSSKESRRNPAPLHWFRGSMRIVRSCSVALVLACGLGPSAAEAGSLRSAGDFGAGIEFAVAAAAAATGDLYVLESFADRRQDVKRFDAAGRLTAQWGMPGPGAGQFKNAADVAVAPDGTVYVADVGNKRIQKFAPDGALLDAAWADTAASSIAIAPDGTVYAGGPPITRYSATGDILGSFGSAGGPLAVDASGKILESGPTGVFRFAPDGRRLNAVGLSAGEGRIAAPGSYQLRPAGLAVTPFGAVVVADPMANRIQQFSVDGRLQAVCGARTLGAFTPTDVASGPGSLFTVEPQRVRRFLYTNEAQACDDLPPTVQSTTRLTTTRSASSTGRMAIRVSVRSSEAATVTTTVSYRAVGRRGRGRCSAPSGANRRGERCSYTKVIERGVKTVDAATDTVTINKRVSCHQPVLTVTRAVDPARNVTTKRATSSRACKR